MSDVGVGRRYLILTLILIASASTVAAQSSRPIFGHAGSSSFRIDTPTGWVADEEAAKYSDTVFVFVPIDAEDRTTGMSITGRYYKDTVPTVAMYRSKRFFLQQDRAAQFVELPMIDATEPRISVEELRSQKFPPMASAYVPLGSDVLRINLSASAQEPYKRGMRAFLDMLKSYTEVQNGAAQSQ